jgi:predicted GNAT family N-acyltransferase
VEVFGSTLGSARISEEGVSTLLMKDVLDIADAQDPPIPVYLEAMPNARPVYERRGFIGVEGKSVQMIRRGPKDVRKLAE